MSVATSTAIIIGSGIAAGGTYAAARSAAGATKEAAKTGAEASGKAAEIEAQTTREALALQERMYNQDRADEAPYRALGGGAIGSLGYLAGIPGFESGKAPVEKPGTLQSLGMQGGTTNANGTQMIDDGPGAVVRGLQGQKTPGGAIARSILAANPQMAMVTLRAPNGQVKQVPPDLAQKYIQAGAVRVQG